VGQLLGAATAPPVILLNGGFGIEQTARVSLGENGGTKRGSIFSLSEASQWDLKPSC